MTDQTSRVSLDEADMADLKAFAQILGVEVKHGHNGSQIRAKILACMPDCKDIPAAPKSDERTFPLPEGYIPVDGEDPTVRPAAISMPASKVLLNHLGDPRVTIRVNKTDDKRRPRDVFISVNGVVIALQRGQTVEIPYRFYEALKNAKEMAAVDSDDINPHSGMPIKTWEEVPSYSFDTLKLPSEEEVAQWLKETGSGFQDNQQQQRQSLVA